MHTDLRDRKANVETADGVGADRVSEALSSRGGFLARLFLRLEVSRKLAPTLKLARAGRGLSSWAAAADFESFDNPRVPHVIENIQTLLSELGGEKSAVLHEVMRQKAAKNPSQANLFVLGGIVAFQPQSTTSTSAAGRSMLEGARLWKQAKVYLPCFELAADSAILLGQALNERQTGAGRSSESVMPPADLQSCIRDAFLIMEDSFHGLRQEYSYHEMHFAGAYMFKRTLDELCRANPCFEPLARALVTS